MRRGEIVLEHATRTFAVRADRGRTLKELVQEIRIRSGALRQEAKAEFNAKKNETAIEVKDGDKVMRTGLVLLRVDTTRGALAIRFE